MTENNSHNDPFDDLFRRNEDHMDIQYQEEDWLKLEKELNKHDAKLAYRRRLGYIAAAAILLISFIGYLTFDNHSRLNQLDRLMEEQMTSNDEPSDSGRQATPGADNSTENEVGGDTGATKQAEGQNSAADQDDMYRFEEEPSGFDNAQRRQADTLKPGSGIDHAEFSLVADCIDCSAIEKPNRDPQNIDGRFSSVNIPTYRDSQTDALSAYSFERGDISGHDHSSDRLSRFSIGVKATPDLSTVGGLSNFQSPGYSFGFDIAYRINERLSVSTGVARSVVKYNANEGGYDMPGYLTGGMIPDRMTGECILLDIPLSLRYDVLSFSVSRIFATGSLSSYIMLNEAYSFGYENSYGSTVESNYDNRTGTSHLMSNAGISIGYEHDLNSRFSVRIEPQLKIPLRQVGVTNVRLFSLGSFFSLSYNL